MMVVSGRNFSLRANKRAQCLSNRGGGDPVNIVRAFQAVMAFHMEAGRLSNLGTACSPSTYSGAVLACTMRDVLVAWRPEAAL